MTTPAPDTAVKRAAALWREASHAVAITGAGISVPSGIPDFRSPGGLWETHAPGEVATLAALRSRPDRVWEFLYDAMAIFGAATPNPAHTALAQLEEAGRLEGVITQNIDGLHQAAGSRNVVEFHGNGMRFYCMRCKTDHDAAHARTLQRHELPWLCECGGVVRPDIVFFGEHIPPHALSESLRLAETADLVVVVGSSGEVAPANTLPGRIKAHGGTMIEINLGQSAFGDMADVVVRTSAERALPAIAALLQ